MTMGYEAQKLLVVSCWQAEQLAVAHEMAVQHFGKWAQLVTPIMGPFVNQRASFFVAPDGSKEGWDSSDDVDYALERYLDWLTNYRKEEPWSYNPFRWGLYQFSADEHDDVWAVGYHHELGAVPALFAKFAARSNGDDEGQPEVYVLHDGRAPAITDEELCRREYEGLCEVAARADGLDVAMKGA